jgi:hypothetical protein
MLDSFNLHETLLWIAEQDPGLGLLLIGGGLIFLVFGWRLFRFMITLSLIIMAAVVASCFAPDEGLAALAIPLAGAVIGGWIGIRTARIAVALAAGGWAAALNLAAMARIGAAPGVVSVVCVIAFAAVAAMAFAAVRPCVAFVTSVEGTILVIGGAMILLAEAPSWWSCVQDAVETNPIFLPFAILAGSVTGYYVQLADMQEKDTGLAVS